jgi:hypothetical protein
MSGMLKTGFVAVKEDGLRAWIWSKRFLRLHDQGLEFHRNEVRSYSKQNLTSNTHLLLVFFYIAREQLCSLGVFGHYPSCDSNRPETLLL